MKYMKFILFLAAVFLIGGCVSKNAAGVYYKSGNYEKAYEYYYKFAKRGYPNASYKIARMIYLGKIDKPPFLEKKYAKYAYKNGYKNASVMIADAYFREKNFDKALKWYDESGLKNFRNIDFKNYLFCINNLKTVNERQKRIKKLENFALKNNNVKLLTVLGKFYISKTPFYNPKKGIKLLSRAYKKNYYPAGVILGVYYIKYTDTPKKGYEILKKVANKSGVAAYYLGDYLYGEMIKNEKLLNNGCITAEFSTPYRFFYKKLKIYKYNTLFTKQNIVKAYRLSYKQGYKKAIYRLINFDIEDNTFELQKNSYSGFNLESAVNFLKSQKDVESKLILAKIYEKYLYLNKRDEAEKIYKWYENINKLQALWHLYQYEKRFEKRVNFKYLDYLSTQKFTPAIIEKAYQEILLNKNVEQNRKILEYYVDQDNILALNYMGSLHSRKIFLPQYRSFDYYKKACMLENKPFYIPSEDLKTANYYMNYEKNNTKGLSVYYYYAQMKNRQAELFMSKYYKNNCKYKKAQMFAEILKNQNDINGKDFYYSMVLQKYIKGNWKKALRYLKDKNTTLAEMSIGDFYSYGYYTDINASKAEAYYKKAYENGYQPAVFSIVNMYKRLNVNHIYDKKIINYLLKLSKNGSQKATLALVTFYINNGYNKKALSTLLKMKNFKSNPKARVLYYRLTGKLLYKQGYSSNYGPLLLIEAEKKAKYAPRSALYLTFRAMLCNTAGASDFALKLMEKINSANVIKSIYEKAKKAPLCKSY